MRCLACGASAERRCAEMKSGRDIDNLGRRSMRVLLMGLILVGAAICVLFFVRTRLLHSEEQREVERYLDEISQRMAETVNGRVNASFQVLETVAAGYPGLLGSVEANAYLRTVVEQYEFRRIGVAAPGGALQTTDGHSIPLESLRVAQAVLGGTERAVGLTASRVDGEAVVVYGVPIRENGLVTGVLTAVNAQESLREYLGVDSFDGAGFSGIITSEGDFIVHYSDSGAAAGAENFFDMAQGSQQEENDALEDMSVDLAAGRTGRISYTLPDGEHAIMCYVPLEVSDWYLLSVVPLTVADEGAGKFLTVSNLTGGAIILLFLILIIVLLIRSWRGEQRVEALAFVDPVTNGRNRTDFERAAAAILYDARPGSYALVSVDIQDFKLVNESFGSEVGDRTLVHVYRVIADGLEKEEIVGRMGDDVFHLLLEYTGRAAMQQRMAALNDDINRRFREVRKDGEKYPLTLVQGICVIDDPELDIVTIQGRANEARKSSKECRGGRGRNCSFYDELHQERMRREKEIGNRMETALIQGEFIIYLQPKVGLKDNIVTGAEALIRWQDPKRGLVPPSDFIPLFERSGFISKLDCYVFEQVCILQRRWLDAGHRPMPVSVNLSRRNVENPDFLDEYVRIRERYQIPDGLLELEITESFFLENGQALLSLIKRIRQAGFQCSLDDFGSGYSSLSLLRVIPVDTIKLDRVFFTDTEYSQRSEYVVQSVLELARRLRMKTVCEGVEESFHLRSLQRLQCDAIQGYIFSPPVPIDRFETLAFSGVPLTPGKEWARSKSNAV